MEPHEFREAKREHRSLLMGPEKKALVWMAARMPARVTSDHLTALTLVAMVLAGASYWWAGASHDRRGLLLACLWLVVNWWGDSLDGTLARVRGAERPRYGFYVDHLVDTFGILFLLLGLALSGYLSPLAAAALVIAYYLLSIELYLATYCVGTFRMSFAGVGATELRLLLCAANIWLFSQPRTPTVVLDLLASVAAAGMVAAAVVAGVRHARLLYRAEPV